MGYGKQKLEWIYGHFHPDFVGDDGWSSEGLRSTSWRYGSIGYHFDLLTDLWEEDSKMARADGF